MKLLATVTLLFAILVPVGVSSSVYCMGAECIYRATQDSVLLVKRSHATGSGVLVKKDQLLTNYHVIECSKGVITYNYNSTAITPGKVIKIDRERDLALIQLSVPSQGSILRISTKHHPGSRVYSIGYPKGMLFTIFEGHYMEEDLGWIFHTARIYPGSSGGPVVQLQKGELVIIGLNTKIAAMYNNFPMEITLSIPGIDLIMFLEKDNTPDIEEELECDDEDE